MFTRAEVTYAWPRDDGTVGSDREPVALFTGEAVHAYPGHLSEAAIEEMLNELATELGAALGQERIYVAFADRTWILDARAPWEVMSARAPVARASDLSMCKLLARLARNFRRKFVTRRLVAICFVLRGWNWNSAAIAVLNQHLAVTRQT